MGKQSPQLEKGGVEEDPLSPTPDLLKEKQLLPLLLLGVAMRNTLILSNPTLSFGVHHHLQRRSVLRKAVPPLMLL